MPSHWPTCPESRWLTSAVMCAQMQMPFHGQSLGMPAQLPSSGDLPGSFPAMGYGHDGSMDSLDCLNDVGLFPPQQSDSMPDYSDLNQAASQMQASPHLSLMSELPLLRRCLAAVGFNAPSWVTMHTY